MAFKGWPTEAIDFFDGLEEDNTRAYWQAHKAVYEQAVKGPMEQLLAELAGEFGAGKIFRPNRDVRFSADKSPYKTSIAAVLGEGGYLQLSAAGLAAGRGLYFMAPDQLERYRRAVADAATGPGLAELVATATAAGLTVTAHDALKTAPRGYPKDHPRADLLRQKGLITWQEWPAGPWLATTRARSRVVGFLHASEPIHDWLVLHVGDTTAPERARR